MNTAFHTVVHRRPIRGAAFPFAFILAHLLFVLLACTSEPGTDASTTDQPTHAERQKAVDDTIAANADCVALSDFYWEIGDAKGRIANGRKGTLFDADTAMAIASASKLVFGAYVVERFSNDLSKADFAAMTMRSGYTTLSHVSCLTAATVQDCLDTGNNGDLTPSEVGFFHYDSGHFQHYAVELGLGSDDNAALASRIKATLGPELAFAYSSPQLAAGVYTTASTYAAFLRKILSGTLAILHHLGENAVCTLPQSCPDKATYSPSPETWHYSWGHWVEDDSAAENDGAFSSPGAFGFYPWIDAEKQYYGLLARYSLQSKAYYTSALCGRRLRKAFITGVAQ
ncbi:MAG: hypothetical protein MUC50_19655 [Myxococcota bacterium]|jgi:CubicO group peptidase (beta-lactamase class C family)|nr:hypothetical protein [Myxococcota bacterium]